MSSLSRVSLQSYKVHKELSEETTAYTTKIALDGKVIGDARNDGRGASDRIYIQPEARADWEAIVAEFSAASGATFEPEDALIAELAKILEEKKVAARLFKKDARVTCVVAVDDGKETLGSMTYYTTTNFHAYAAVTGERIDANIREQYDGNPYRKYLRGDA